MDLFGKSRMNPSTATAFTRRERKVINDTRGYRTPLKAGIHINNLLIEGVLGGGGFSIVYSCYDTDSGENIVLKEYFPVQSCSRNKDNQIHPISIEKKPAFDIGMHQFFDEALALAKIKHPNIINVLDVFRHNNTAYMTSKMQAGRDLRWFIKRCAGDLDQAFLEKTILPIMSGLELLHRNNILHLDIKPANIFLRVHSGPLLLDFGAAKALLKESRFDSFQTLTPGFAPPEQHRKNELRPASDIYSLGATIYACITGRAPPTSLKREEKELKLHSAEKHISPNVIEAMKWALDLDIDKRPQSVSEFGDRLLEGGIWKSFDDYQQYLRSSR